MRIRWFVLAATLLSWPVFLLASSPEVTLVSPQDGAHFDGGQEAVLSWTAPLLPAGAVEWEAFLSVDDGAHYPIRITPHLHAGLRTFRWSVPDVATAHARLMLRFGNESDEQIVALSQTFAIVPQYRALDLAALRVTLVRGTGEAALDDGHPSIEWVTGGRSGEHLVTNRHHDSAASGARRVRLDNHFGTPALTGSPSALHGKREPAERAFHLSMTSRLMSSCLARPLLLLSTRMNI